MRNVVWIVVMLVIVVCGGTCIVDQREEINGLHRQVDEYFKAYQSMANAEQKTLKQIHELEKAGSNKPLVAIPTCDEQVFLDIPKDGRFRIWANAVEVNLPSGNRIYHCDELKQPSPSEVQ